MKMPWDRLKGLREAAGFPNPTSFAEAHDLKSPTYLAHERPEGVSGHRGIKKKQAEAYAEMFKQHGLDVTPEWLLHGHGTDPLAHGDIKPENLFTQTMAPPAHLDTDAVQQAAVNVLELIKEEGLDERSDIIAKTIVDLAGEYTRQRMEQERSLAVPLGERVITFPRYADPRG